MAENNNFIEPDYNEANAKIIREAIVFLRENHHIMRPAIIRDAIDIGIQRATLAKVDEGNPDYKLYVELDETKLAKFMKTDGWQALGREGFINVYNALYLKGRLSESQFIRSVIERTGDPIYHSLLGNSFFNIPFEDEKKLRGAEGLYKCYRESAKDTETLIISKVSIWYEEKTHTMKVKELYTAASSEDGITKRLSCGYYLRDGGNHLFLLRNDDNNTAQLSIITREFRQNRNEQVGGMRGMAIGSRRSGLFVKAVYLERFEKSEVELDKEIGVINLDDLESTVADRLKEAQNAWKFPNNLVAM